MQEVNVLIFDAADYCRKSDVTLNNICTLISHAKLMQAGNSCAS